MIRSYRRFAEQNGWKGHNITPRHILLHTLSHAATRALASLSGYGEASIRERLYVDDDINGILLYTASPSADGSLGGLARQGDATNFERILRAALLKCETCSRDPLCAESYDGNAADPGHERVGVLQLLPAAGDQLRDPELLAGQTAFSRSGHRLFFE